MKQPVVKISNILRFLLAPGPGWPSGLFVFALLLLSACQRPAPAVQTGKGFLTEAAAEAKIASILSQIQEPKIPADTINIMEFSGHSPDMEGSLNFQPYIQAAIDTLAARGGGWVLLPNTATLKNWVRYTQTYRVQGSIELKSHTGLLIDRSVRLFFPFDPESYLNEGQGVLTRYEGTTIYSFAPLIRAFNAENIAIKARGETGAMPTINGDGEKWQRWMWEGEGKRREQGLKPAYQLLKDVNNDDVPIAERVYTDPEKDYFRPETMEFFHCKNVLVDGIKIENSPFWCVKPVFSESCTFRNMAFNAMAVNNDGIDPESSRNVLIENVQFGNHDDNIAIKAGRDREGREGALVAGTELENLKSRYIDNGRITGPTENVVIRNCHFYGHYAICIGSEMSGGVRDIYAVDNYSVKEVNMGVFLKSSRLRGGTIENVYVNRLTLNKTRSEVVAIIPNYDKADDSPFPPNIRNVQIENVTCQQGGGGIVVYGWPDAPVRQVLLRNIHLKQVPGKPVVVKQSENVVLDSVSVNGKVWNETFSNVEGGQKPPEKI